MPYAVIFPGQGAAAPGAGVPWRDHPAWSLVAEAEAVLDRPLARLLLEADQDELSTTRASQLAVFLTSLMAWDAFSARVDEPPVAFAGHSLGQITALVAAGAIDRADGFRLAAERAELSQRSADANPGRMAALIGADLEDAERLCAQFDDVWVANDNAPGQVVIAGTVSGLAAAVEAAPGMGLRKPRALDVGHAFHTPLLADAAEGLRPLLERLTFRTPTAPIVTNTDGKPQTDPSCWAQQLTRHLVEPVLWRQCQETLRVSGAGTFVELGPGRVLAGLAKRTVPDVTVRNVSQPTELAQLGEASGLMEVVQ
ncbi:MAG TPA: ACP S-malonyltransferase [Acidimicrobiales bacterium]